MAQLALEAVTVGSPALRAGAPIKKWEACYHGIASCMNAGFYMLQWKRAVMLCGSRFAGSRAAMLYPAVWGPDCKHVSPRAHVSTPRTLSQTTELTSREADPFFMSATACGNHCQACQMVPDADFGRQMLASEAPEEHESGVECKQAHRSSRSEMSPPELGSSCQGQPGVCVFHGSV